MSRHLWSAGEHRIVLDEILQNYKSKDFNEVLIGASEKVNLEIGKIKVLYTSFSRISQGHEPNVNGRGRGHNWGSNVEHSFNEWRSFHKLTQSQLNIIFS